MLGSGSVLIVRDTTRRETYSVDTLVRRDARSELGKSEELGDNETHDAKHRHTAARPDRPRAEKSNKKETKSSEPDIKELKTILK